MIARTIRETTLYEGHFKAVKQEAELEDGRRITHETVVHPGAVVILPIVAPGKVLLVHQYRHSVGKWLMEIPAGTLEPGESPVDCAARELIEEVEHKAGTMEELGMVYPAPGFCTEMQHLFLAKELSPCNSGTRDEDEMIEIVEWSVERFEEEIRKCSITDSKTITAFCRARLRGLI